MQNVRFRFQWSLTPLIFEDAMYGLGGSDYLNGKSGDDYIDGGLDGNDAEWRVAA